MSDCSGCPSCVIQKYNIKNLSAMVLMDTSYVVVDNKKYNNKEIRTMMNTVVNVAIQDYPIDIEECLEFKNGTTGANFHITRLSEHAYRVELKTPVKVSRRIIVWNKK